MAKVKNTWDKKISQKKKNVYPLSLTNVPRGTGYRVQGTGYRVQGTGYRVQGTGYRVQGTGYLAMIQPTPAATLIVPQLLLAAV